MSEEKAKRVVEILDDMEKHGEFDGLTEEEREIKRQILGMRIRADMDKE